MKRIKVFYLLTIVLCLSLTSFTQEKVVVKVVDNEGVPVLGVDVIQANGPYRLGNTNEQGDVTFQVIESDDPIMIIFNCLGYHRQILALEELKTNPKITLNIKVYDIEEVVVRALPNLEKLTDKLYKSHKKKYSAKRFHVRYYGYGHYVKVVESKNKTVNQRHEYGLFLTSGDNSKKDKWDLAYEYSFIPKYIARSFDLTSDGKDTLKNLCITRSPNKNLNYTAYNEKIFDIIRAIYLYGPIFSEPDHFNFEYADVEDDIWTLSFQTKTSAFPKKTECLSKGTLQFNKSSNKIIKIEFSFLDYQSTTLVRYRSKDLPFKTEVSIKIGYDSEGHAYISQCASSTMWNSNFDSETYALGRQPSRPFATKNRLVEKEFWSTESYKVIPESLKDKETDNQAGWAAISMGTYNKDFFKNNPCPILSIDEFQQLNRYMPLEDQYKLNSGNFYGYDETLQTLEKRLFAKKIIFEKFDKLNN